METDANRLHRLIYVSHAVVPFSAEDLERLLVSARAFNQTIGVTGLLLYHDGNFIQVIEGSAASLAKLMSKIEKDTRHRGIIMMNAIAPASRAFGEWSMGYVPSGRLSGAQQEGLLNLRAFAQSRDFARAGGADVEIQIETFLSTFREFEAA